MEARPKGGAFHWKELIRLQKGMWHQGCNRGDMRMLCEKSLELDNDVFICFVDFEKAFDRVD